MFARVYIASHIKEIDNLESEVFQELRPILEEYLEIGELLYKIRQKISGH